MSKKLVEVQHQQKVFSILQANIDNQRNQVETSQIILNEIVSIRHEVGKKFDEMTEMVQEVRDSVTLTNAECDKIQSAVATKSILLTKDRYQEEDATFSQVVGKHRRLIWSKLKQKYSVPKYNCIRRIDFEEAIGFINDFRLEDYI